MFRLFVFVLLVSICDFKDTKFEKLANVVLRSGDKETSNGNLEAATKNHSIKKRETEVAEESKEGIFQAIGNLEMKRPERSVNDDETGIKRDIVKRKTAETGKAKERKVQEMTGKKRSAKSLKNDKKTGTKKAIKKRETEVQESTDQSLNKGTGILQNIKINHAIEKRETEEIENLKQRSCSAKSVGEDSETAIKRPIEHYLQKRETEETEKSEEGDGKEITEKKCSAKPVEMNKVIGMNKNTNINQAHKQAEETENPKQTNLEMERSAKSVKNDIEIGVKKDIYMIPGLQKRETENRNERSLQDETNLEKKRLERSATNNDGIGELGENKPLIEEEASEEEETW